MKSKLLHMLHIALDTETNEGWAYLQYMHETMKPFIMYETHIEVHEDGVVLSGVLLSSGYSLPGNRPVGQAHQNLDNKKK